MEGKIEIVKRIEKHFLKQAKYISNQEIKEFLDFVNIQPGTELFNKLKNYYRVNVSMPRSIFLELEKSLDNVNKPLKRLELPLGYQDFLDLLVLQRYSRKTIKNYKIVVAVSHRWYLKTKNKNLSEIEHIDLKDFFLYMTKEKKYSASTIRIYRFALQLYFHQILKKKLDFQILHNIRKSDHLPCVLSKSEVHRLLNSFTNLKHKLLFSLMYSSGLRISEVLSIKVKDVDFERLTLIVREGKGKKDRHTIFSDKLKNDLICLIENKNPHEFVFISNQGGGKSPLHTRTAQKLFQNALKKAGIKKNATPHDLRHSFATHLLESGVDIRYIQSLLGHKNISTTTIYTRVANPAIRTIKSPL